jgi:TATA-box binding protein (TBP) (component of TFIID and TFIIIB)
LGVGIDLLSLVTTIDTAVNEYEPESYPGMILQVHGNEATIIVFSSGKYNIAGAPSVLDLEDAHKRFVALIEKSLETTFHHARDTLEIRNLVFVDDLNQELNLAPLIELFGDEYAEHAEEFPALNYRPPDYEGLFKIFTSGKVTLTGTTDLAVAEEQFNKLREQLIRAQAQESN